MKENAGGKRFEDYFEDPKESAKVSDSELHALMQRSLERIGGEATPFAPGAKVQGTVISVGSEEVLVELGTKTAAFVEPGEFAGDLPLQGSSIAAEVEGFDRERRLLKLTVKATRQKEFQKRLRVGDVHEGTVQAVNKGGLTVDLGGVRAFLPASQVARAPVPDMAALVGKKLRCEVTSIDRVTKDVVVSSRRVLAREGGKAAPLDEARIHVGAVLGGQVVRVNVHGAFIDLGGVEGLLHASKLRTRSRGGGATLESGQSVSVRVVHVDSAAGRIGLEWAAQEGAAPAQNLADYHAGDAVAGVVTVVTSDGAFVLIDEGVQAFLPASSGMEPKKGSVIQAVIHAVDPAARRIELRSRS